MPRYLAFRYFLWNELVIHVQKSLLYSVCSLPLASESLVSLVVKVIAVVAVAAIAAIAAVVAIIAIVAVVAVIAASDELKQGLDD